MVDFKSISQFRRDFGDLNLNEEDIDVNPITQFKQWFAEVLKHEKSDPTAMVLSTVDEKGMPDSRVVLLKDLNEAGHFIFFTNYQSSKAKQITYNPQIALNFFWPELARQIRIRGKVKKVLEEESDTYFATRPFMSQLGAIVSPQSQTIKNRAFLEDAISQLLEQPDLKMLPRPSFWGGYEVIPDEIEFWQGRDNRLHDRIQYYKKNELWEFCRLAP